MTAYRQQAARSGQHEASLDVIQLLKPLFRELGRLPASLVLDEINAASMQDIGARPRYEIFYEKDQHRHLQRSGTLLEALQGKANDRASMLDTMRKSIKLEWEDGPRKPNGLSD